MWMRDVTCEWVMSHVNESCHTWISHVIYGRVMSHVNESCHIRLSHSTHEWVTSHRCIYHVRAGASTHFPRRFLCYDTVDTFEKGMSHINRSCHSEMSCHTWTSSVAYEWVLSRVTETCSIWTSRVTHTFICHVRAGALTHVSWLCTCGWVISHLNGVISHMNESCRIWMSHVTYDWVALHMNESRNIYMYMSRASRCFSTFFMVMYMCMSHVTSEWVMSHMNESCRIRTSHVAYEWVMSHMNESCRIWMSHAMHN